MGGPKALLLWNDKIPLVVAHARARLTDCEATIVVARQSIAEKLRPLGAELSIVVSDAPDDWGPAGSIYALAQSGRISQARELLIGPVDMPPLSHSSLVPLFVALSDSVNAVRPVFASRGGHPVLVRASVILNHYQQHAPSLRDVLRSLGPGFVDAQVDDPDVLVDLDTPDAFKNRLGREPAFWIG